MTSDYIGEVPPGTVFFSNFGNDYDEAKVAEAALARFPMVPREALTIRRQVQSWGGGWQCFVAREFKPEVDAFKAELDARLRVLDIWRWLR